MCSRIVSIEDAPPPAKTTPLSVQWIVAIVVIATALIGVPAAIAVWLGWCGCGKRYKKKKEERKEKKKAKKELIAFFGFGA